MVLRYVPGAARTAWSGTKSAAGTLKDDIKAGAGNAGTALTTGTAPDVDLERRHVLELGAGAAAAYLGGSTNAVGESADWAGDQVPDVQWQVGPFGSVDQENEVNTEKTPVSTPTPTATETEEDIDWVENYDVESFTEDLYDQSDFSVDATNDLFETAYSRAGNEINEVGITEDDTFKVNELGSSLYTENPGLGYSKEFGETLKVLDNEEKLDDLVEGYVEQELV